MLFYSNVIAWVANNISLWKIILYTVQLKAEIFFNRFVLPTKRIYSILLIKRIANTPFLQRWIFNGIRQQFVASFHLFAYFSRTCEGQISYQISIKELFLNPFPITKIRFAEEKRNEIFPSTKTKAMFANQSLFEN